MEPRFEGVIPALTTPFDEGGEVDAIGLRRNVESMLAAGITDFVTCGTLGEAGALSERERKLVIGTVVSTVGTAGGVIAGISATCAEDAIANARIAVEAGASGAMCLPPTSYSADDGEVLAFYDEVAAAIELPIVAYNNPAEAGRELSVELVIDLAQLDGVVALKEATTDARRYAALNADAPAGFRILIGADDCALEGYAAGAVGWISGVANAAPAVCLELERLCRGGDFAAARELWSALLPFARHDVDPKLVQYIKGALDRVGLVGGPARAPRGPLRAGEERELDASIQRLRDANLLGSPESATA